MHWNRRVLALTALVSLLASGCASSRDATVVVTDSETDTVWVRVLLNAGSAYDPPGKEGLAYATATAVGRGYGSGSSERVAERLAALSAQIDVWVDREVCGFDGRCPREAWPEFAALFTSMFAEPQVGNDAIANLVADQLTALESLRHDDARLARALLQYRLYGDHPYAHPPEGFDHTVIDLVPSDIRDYWESHYLRSGLSLGLAGDISRAEAGEFRKLLASVLPAGESPRVEPPDVVVEGLQVAIIEMPGPEARCLLLGRPAEVVRGDPDFPAFQLANAWLGRHGGHLTEILDEKRNISFVTWSYVEHTEPYVESDLLTSGRPRQRQYVSVETQPATVNAAFVVYILLEEFSEVVSRGFTVPGLDEARSDLIERIQENARHPAYRMGTELDDRWLGLPESGLEIDGAAVSLEDARRALRRLVDPVNLMIVAVVPSGQGLATQLLRHQITSAYPEGIDRLSLRAEDLVYLAYTPLWEPQKLRIFRAAELFR